MDSLPRGNTNTDIVASTHYSWGFCRELPLGFKERSFSVHFRNRPFAYSRESANTHQWISSASLSTISCEASSLSGKSNHLSFNTLSSSSSASLSDPIMAVNQPFCGVEVANVIRASFLGYLIHGFELMGSCWVADWSTEQLISRLWWVHRVSLRVVYGVVLIWHRSWVACFASSGTKVGNGMWILVGSYVKEWKDNGIE